RGPGGRVVRAEQWAAVVRALVQQRIAADDFQLRTKVRAILDNGADPTQSAPSATIDIDLPDLEEQVDSEIVANNLKAIQAIYFAAQLEELKVFQVMDK